MSNSVTTSARPLADWIGISGSTLCALHCLIVPLSLVIGPLGSLPQVDDELFHRVLLWIVIPSAAVAFGVGCSQHRDRRVLVLGVLGLFCMTAAFTLLHDFLGENGERVMATASAALLITAHVRNYRLCRSGACEHDPSPGPA